VEKPAIAANWVTDGIYRCRVGFLKAKYVEKEGSSEEYDGRLVQVVSIYDKRIRHCQKIVQPLVDSMVAVRQPSLKLRGKKEDAERAPPRIKRNQTTGTSNKQRAGEHKEASIQTSL
jgi:hypothetical protein